MEKEKKDLEFRKLTKDEIELRVGATTDSGFSLLLYKTARVDAKILDETVGKFNWTKRFYQVKNTMICEIGIYSEEHKTFIFKGDAGDESNTEAIKGEASDSFKRAGFAWGIGRELYTSPFIWVKKDQDNDPKRSRYQVVAIDYKDNEISKLAIINEKTKQVVFSLGDKSNYSQNAEKPQKKDILEEAQKGIADTFDQVDTIVEPLSEEDKTFLQAYIGNLTANEYKSFFEWLKRKYGVSNIVELNAEQGRNAVWCCKQRNK